MGHFDPGPPKKEYTPPALFKLFQLAMTAINNIDKTNFRRKIAGSDIIAKHSLSMNTLAWREFVMPLVMAAPYFQTNNTEPQNVGGYFPWIPSSYPGPGSWYFEADIAITNEAGTASARLRGIDAIKTVTTQQTGLDRVRSDPITMPSTAQNIWVQVFSSSGSYHATIAGAKLIFVPS